MKNKKNLLPILFFLAVLILLFILLYTPGFYSNVMGSIPELPPSGQNGNITNPDDIDDNPNLPITITRENVQDVIAALSRPSEYFYETQSELIYTGGTKQYLRRKWERSGWSRIDIMNSVNSVETRLIYGGGSVFIWRPGDYDYYRTKSGDFTADTSQMIMVYEDILAVPKSAVLNAQYTMYEGTPCIYVEISNESLNYRERYWVSTENGLLVFGQTLSNNIVFYNVKALEVIVEPQPETLFYLPGGQLAMDLLQSE